MPSQTTTSKDASPIADLDSTQGYKAILDDVLDYRTRNFAVEFNAAGATCAVNVLKDGMEAASRMSNASNATSCRWLNIWSPSVDECSEVRAILTSYGVSRRLAHLLCPGTAKSTHVDPQRHDIKEKIGNAHASDGGSQESSPSGTVKQPVDQQRDDFPKKTTAPSMDNITKDLWHFCSIDWGRRYACISYNALFTAPHVEESVLSRRPAAIRIWSAIVLCDDGLVISIFETPKGLPPDQIKTIRKNQVNLLKNLSWQYDANNAEAGIFQVDVRPSRAPPDTDLPGFDHFAAASRLFYYLFDDWRATFELVSGRQHPYRQKLHEVRARMSKTPLVEDVEKLHQLGQQLVILQRVYQGYEKLVDRLLQRQRHVSMALWQTAQRRQSDLHLLSRQGSGGGEQGISTTSLPTETDPWITETEADQKTIRLPLGTVARFERLLDRIRLYALIEIKECIAEKEALVLLTFNLVNLKNAAAIERLTRVTILLAKVTILFLPVSLMTAYFGISLDSIDQLYSLETYWVCFVVVGFLTTILLLFFTMANNKVIGQINYQSLTRMLMQVVKRGGGKVTSREKEEA